MRECCGRFGSHAQTPATGVRRAGCTRSVRPRHFLGRPQPCRKAKIPILNEKSGPQTALFNRFGKGFSRCSLLGGLLRKKDLPVFVPHRLDAAVVRHPGGSTTMDSASTRLAGRITTNLQHCWDDKVYNRVGIFVVLAVEIVRGHERHSEESDADRPPRKSEPAPATLSTRGRKSRRAGRTLRPSPVRATRSNMPRPPLRTPGARTSCRQRPRASASRWRGYE